MKIQVLDHGYVEFIEAWGRGGLEDDCEENNFNGRSGDSLDYERGIIEAARQSTQGSFRGWEQDGKLIKYLYENKHETPFEFAGMVIEVQAPIFVFREWQRHRTQSYNEMSARYAPLPDLYYLPSLTSIHERAIAAQTAKDKQSGAMSEVWESKLNDWYATVDSFYTRAEMLYQAALKSGVPKELARITMPVGHYSRMRASTNLRNWLSFLTLRTDPKAQYEIRCFANAVLEIVEEKFPQTATLWAMEQLICDDNTKT